MKMTVTPIRAAKRFRPHVVLIARTKTEQRIQARLVHKADKRAEVHVFDHPTSALASLRDLAHRRVDLVLYTYCPTQGQRLEVLRQLRSLNSCATVPIVLVADIPNDVSDAMTACAAGASLVMEPRTMDVSGCVERLRRFLVAETT